VPIAHRLKQKKRILLMVIFCLPDLFFPEGFAANPARSSINGVDFL